MCLMNVQPVPIKTMVMNKTAPFNLFVQKFKWIICIDVCISKKSEIHLQMCHVVQNGPRFNMFALNFDKVKIDGMKHQWQRF